MSHPLARIVAVVAVVLAAIVSLAEAKSAAQPRSARAAACHPALKLIAHGQGAPDDLVWEGGTLLVSDINRGTIGVVSGGHVRTIVAHLHAPEGIVPGPGHSLIVADQATNSVVQVRLPSGARTTLATLPLPRGQSGIDGINADGAGSVFVPDSARGRLYVLHLATRKLAVVASGMVRPVAAINWDHAIVVADEYANAVWRIGHTRTRLANVTLPDDLAVVSGHLISSSLIGKVWEASPHLRLLSSAFRPASDPQGLVGDGPGAVIVADQGRNAIYRLSGLSGCL